MSRPAPRPPAPPLAAYTTLRRVRLPPPEPRTARQTAEEAVHILLEALYLLLVWTLEIVVFGLRPLWRWM